MIKKIQTTPVFKKLLKAEAAGYNVIKLEGGSRSSKTWSIFQLFYGKAIRREKFDVTITRQYLQLVKDTLLRDFNEMTSMYELPLDQDVNPRRPMQDYMINQGEFVFWGLDKPGKAHGRKQKYAWMNEVMEIPNRDAFDQLEMRTEGLIILDYNPSDEDHWVFELDKRPDVITIKSTQRDNPFLPIKIRQKILSYEPTPENIANGTADEYMWQVYGLGNPAKLKGAIFENWDIVDSIPANAKFLGYGLDFGHSNDPAALIAVYLYDKKIYLDEVIYETGLVNISPLPEVRTLSTAMRELGIEFEEITADSAEPKSIMELSHAGFNIHGARKGPDSIRYGIDLMKGYQIHLTKRSINLQNEFRKYKWAEDATGKSLKKPIDAFNHGIDAARYRISRVLRGQSGIQVIKGAGGLGI